MSADQGDDDWSDLLGPIRERARATAAEKADLVVELVSADIALKKYIAEVQQLKADLGRKEGERREGEAALSAEQDENANLKRQATAMAHEHEELMKTHDGLHDDIHTRQQAVNALEQQVAALKDEIAARDRKQSQATNIVGFGVNEAKRAPTYFQTRVKVPPFTINPNKDAAEQPPRDIEFRELDMGASCRESLEESPPSESMPVEILQVKEWTLTRIADPTRPDYSRVLDGYVVDQHGPYYAKDWNMEIDEEHPLQESVEDGADWPVEGLEPGLPVEMDDGDHAQMSVDKGTEQLEERSENGAASETQREEASRASIAARYQAVSLSSRYGNFQDPPIVMDPLRTRSQQQRSTRTFHMKDLAKRKPVCVRCRKANGSRCSGGSRCKECIKKGSGRCSYMLCKSRADCGDL